jgi:hypothetical protein
MFHKETLSYNKNALNIDDSTLFDCLIDLKIKNSVFTFFVHYMDG